MLKKKSVKTKILIVLSILAVIAVGTVAVLLGVKSNRADEKRAYMSLRYIEINDYETASNYLDEIKSQRTNKIGFVKDSVEIMGQYSLGNKTLAQIETDILFTDYNMSDEQQSVAEYFRIMTREETTDGYEKIVKQLLYILDVPDERLEMYEAEFDIGNEAYMMGQLTSETRQKYVDIYGEAAADKLEMSVLLSTGNYTGAFTKAVENVMEKPTEENRILLADIIARASANGSPIDDAYFYNVTGTEYDPDDEEDRREDLDDKIEEIQEEIENISFQMETETDEDDLAQLSAELDELQKEQTIAENMRDNLLVYKAINSIENISSPEAEVVKAKLYFVVEENEKAMDILQKTADSVKAITCDNPAVKEGLEVLKNLSTGDVYSKSELESTVPEALDRMLNGVNSDVMIRNNDYTSYYRTGVEELLRDAIVAEYKYLDNMIYITGFDASNYPEITMNLNGRREVLEEIVKKQSITLKDTHYEVKYKASFDEEARASICFVVDTSGSMSGTPLENAKEALITYAKQKEENTQIALVEFNNYYTVRADFSSTSAEYTSASENLYANGGTDITSGIAGGIEVLEMALGTKNIILMTDGQSGLDNSIVEQAKQKGITIYTVGFGDVDSVMLEGIAEETGGTFTLASSSEDLAKVYESIGTIIGNSVKLTYTVSENADENSRYVYVASDAYGSTNKHEYLVNDNSANIGDAFYITQSYVYNLVSMEQIANRGEKVSFTFPYGYSGLVTEVEVGGKKATVSEDYGYVEVKMDPITKEGLYDIKVTFTDGSQRVVENAFLVYDDSVQGSWIWDTRQRIGCLNIYANSVYNLADGTIVLAGAIFNENLSDSNTLSARTNNLVVVEGCTPGDEYYEDTYYKNWGDTGSFYLDGVITLDSSDAQSQNGSRAISAMGKITGAIDGQQCVITTK